MTFTSSVCVFISCAVLATTCALAAGPPSSSAAQHQTATVAHLEPLSHIEWHELGSDHPINAKNIGSNKGGRRLGSIDQPHEDAIHLAFTAFGVRFEHDMALMRPLYDTASTFKVKGADGVMVHLPHRATSYSKHMADGTSWITATILHDGLLHVVVQHEDGETYQVDPVREHQHDMDDDGHRRLKAAAVHGMVSLCWCVCVCV